MGLTAEWPWVGSGKDGVLRCRRRLLTSEWPWVAGISALG